MKEGLLDKDVFDHIFKELVREKSWRGGCIIRTFDIAKKLWSKYRVPYKAEAEIVRKKMREWWDSYEWRGEPRPHKMVCGYAVYLSAPMNYDYCMLERSSRIGQSLISLYYPQKEFQEKIKEE